MSSLEIDQLIEKYGIENVSNAVTPLLEESRIATLEGGLDTKLQSVTVVLENIYDPHNGSAALRSAEAFGLCDLHTIDPASGIFSASPEVSLGTQKWVELHNHANAELCASTLKGQGFVLCATVPGAELDLEDLPVDRPLAIWFGNERDGLTTEAQNLCDYRVSIAMHGFCQSFNLSVSVAMFVHRLANRRRAELGTAGDLDENRRSYLRARWRAQGIRGLGHIIERYVSSLPR